MQCPTNASAKPNTVITNLQVTFSATPNDDPYKSSYAYRASVTHSDITEDMSATIVFNDAQASSGNYAPFCVTYDGGIYIYAKVNTTITIPTIKVNGVISYFNLQGNVGDDTHPVKIVNGEAVPVSNSLVSITSSTIGSDTKPVKIVNGQAVAVTTNLVRSGAYYPQCIWIGYVSFAKEAGDGSQIRFNQVYSAWNVAGNLDNDLIGVDGYGNINLKKSGYYSIEWCPTFGSWNGASRNIGATMTINTVIMAGEQFRADRTVTTMNMSMDLYCSAGDILRCYTISEHKETMYTKGETGGNIFWATPAHLAIMYLGSGGW